jgi:hypothetical protein
MDPYATPNETKVGRNRPKIEHIAEDPQAPRTRRERQLQKEGVVAERRAIKKSARRHLKKQMLSELDEPG